MMREDRREWIRKAGLASSIGLVLVVSTVIGYGLGLLLQRVFHTGDWIVFICLLLGIAAGFVEMFRIVMEITREE